MSLFLVAVLLLLLSSLPVRLLSFVACSLSTRAHKHSHTHTHKWRTIITQATLMCLCWVLCSASRACMCLCVTLIRFILTHVIFVKQANEKEVEEEEEKETKHTFHVVVVVSSWSRNLVGLFGFLISMAYLLCILWSARVCLATHKTPSERKRE